MNNAYAMSASLEAKHRSQAYMITAGFAGLMLLIMFLLKWETPTIEPKSETEIDVEITYLPTRLSRLNKKVRKMLVVAVGNRLLLPVPLVLLLKQPLPTSKDWDEDTEKDAPR